MPQHLLWQSARHFAQQTGISKLSAAQKIKLLKLWPGKTKFSSMSQQHCLNDVQCVHAQKLHSQHLLQSEQIYFPTPDKQFQLCGHTTQ